MFSQPWIAAWFCAALSLIALAEQVAVVPAGTGISIAFLAFLPMCFFFAGAEIWQMQRDILELTKQVSELREKWAG